MTAPAWFWIVFTVFAAALQTGRNALQRELTAALGAVGAAHVRFLFGTPFAILFLVAVLVTSHAGFPHTNAAFWLWIAAGALAQILGTALMLMTMEQRSFVVATAYIKTEPVFVALFGLLFLADPVTLPMFVSILIATAGVIVISFSAKANYADLHTAMLGLGSGLAFAIAAIGFRGAILSLALPGYVVPATFTLAVGLVIQAAALSLWLAIRDPKTLAAMMRLWRPSLSAGFLGALASEFWFLAFALTSAANVRTLGLIDVVFAQAVSRFVFRHHTTPREYAGIAILLTGAILLVVVHR
ncbi:MAG: DMT family transporter [Proteobacteria bacterium]|nr:DMT family transporter [Pseudomonadota bacterium]